MVYLVKYAKRAGRVASALARPTMYNEQVAKLNALTAAGQIFCLAPEQAVKVGRLEGNTKKLTQLYHQGLAQAEATLPALLAYLTR